MSTLDKMFKLFELRVQGDCSKKITRKLLAPILQFFDLYEQDKCSDVRRSFLQDVCDKSHFQVFSISKRKETT